MALSPEAAAWVAAQAARGPQTALRVALVNEAAAAWDRYQAARSDPHRALYRSTFLELRAMAGAVGEPSAPPEPRRPVFAW